MHLTTLGLQLLLHEFPLLIKLHHNVGVGPMMPYRLHWRILADDDIQQHHLTARHNPEHFWPPESSSILKLRRRKKLMRSKINEDKVIQGKVNEDNTSPHEIRRATHIFLAPPKGLKSINLKNYGKEQCKIFKPRLQSWHLHCHSSHGRE